MMNRSGSPMLNSRRNFLAATVVVLMGILGVRFFQYQILNFSRFQAYADRNSIRSIRLTAPRGILLDRNGHYLVTNRPYYSLGVVPAEVRASLEQLSGIGKYLDIAPDTIAARILRITDVYDQFQPMVLYESLNFIQLTHIEEHRIEFPGIFFMDRTVRHYPSRARATHVIGYLRAISPDDMRAFKDRGYRPGDQIGAVGLERQLEPELRGTEGYRYHLVDNLLRDLGAIPDRPPERPLPGSTIRLSLDIDMQALGEQLLEGKRGTLLALDPETGELLAFVSAPDYVLEPFTGSIPESLWNQWRDNPDKVLLNRPINGLYPPGSPFKLLTAAVALSEGMAVPSDTVTCTGFYYFGDRNFRCNVLAGHGVVNLEQAIAQSCNIYFYKLIQKVGFDPWQRIVREFGFGQQTGIELPLESGGLVPSRAYMDKKYADVGWTVGHMLNLVLGQGDILVTPLQIVRMTAAISNRGKLVRPTLIHDAGNRFAEAPQVNLPDEVWDHLQQAMYQVVNGFKGSGFRARIPGERIYGKTGTAENPHGLGHSWFTGYAVGSEGDRLVVAVLVEGGGLGSRIAAPMAKQIFEYYLKSYLPSQRSDIAQVP